LSGLAIRPVAARDAADLLRFELAHRAYFERWINGRDPSFYSERGVASACRTMGRVNLTKVRRAHFQSADLGYRVGEHDGGRGVASTAVALCLEQAFGALGLLRLEAVARPENQGSVRVLERNGFRQFGHSRRSFQLGGEWFDRLLFERHRD
jgi:ribosomal-protein-alanine N-acetyltransferase